MDRKPSAHGRVQWLAVIPLLVAIAVLAALALASVELLSAVRAYVGGESLWSKGQKDAVYHLERYLSTREPADHERHLAALTVPLADRRARLALEQKPPARDEARRALIDGGNHPSDAQAMVALYLHFRWVSFMAAAIEIWAEADDRIAELDALGRRAQALIASGERGAARLQPLSDELLALNGRLTGLERRFSDTLAEGSRTVHRLVFASTLIIATCLMLGAMLATRAVLRRQSRAEAELREINDRWSLAADAAGLGLFDWDLRTQRTRVDARGAALYGLPAVPLEGDAGELTRDRIHPDDVERFRGTIARAIANPSSAAIRYRVRLDHGDERHIEAVARVRPGDSGVGTRMVGTLRDVTAEVRSAQLRLDMEAAERASRAKSDFLSRVSHELRTPLNAVLGFSELLQGDPAEPLTPQQAQRVQRVIEAGRHLLALIDDILLLSELDGPGGTPVLAPVALQPVIEAALLAHSSAASERGVTLQAPRLPAGLQARTEPRRLAKVLQQLLSNAVKFNRPGGEVRVNCHRIGHEVSIEVHDSGPGLQPDQLAQLFQPFNRLGAEHTKVPGSGLGLVIVHKLLHQLGGRLEPFSTHGVGTCMRVVLPAAADDAQAAAER